MKEQIAKAVNTFLKPLGIKIVKAASHGFDMSSAIHRILAHGIPISSVIDIGASNGRWSINAMRFFPEASFLAIEPLVEQKDALERLSNRRSNFDYVLCAAGDADNGQVTLCVADDLDGSTVDGTNGRNRNVPTRTIDSVISQKEMNGPYLLKFDTHGYELPILKGAEATLGQTSVIIMEVYNFTVTRHFMKFHEVCAHMEQLGFQCYDVADLLLRPYDNALWQMDLFFCRSNSEMFTYQKYF